MKFRDMAAIVCGEDRFGLQIDLSMSIAHRLSTYVVGINIVEETGALGFALESTECEFWPFYSALVTDHRRCMPSVDVATSDRMKARIVERMVSAYDGIEVDFHEALQRHALGGEWHILFHSELSSLAALARRADFILLPNVAVDGAQGSPARLLRDLVVLSDRPLLQMAPMGQTFNLPKTVLVGWDGSAAADRAMRAALPLLEEVRKVELLTIDGRKEEDSAAPMIARLERHGIAARWISCASAGRSVAETLIAHAEDAQADLVVAGAYGHSRIRELLIGSTTGELIDKSAIPLFLCH